jgi:diguanylate cyclase (GGDEF)-like protein
MVAVFILRILCSRHALAQTAAGSSGCLHVGLETTWSAMLGAGWGFSVYVFDTRAMDQAFYLRFMILAGAMAFVLSSTAMFLRVFLAYTLAIAVLVIAFIQSASYVQPKDALFTSIVLYTAMVFALAISTNRRIRKAISDHIAVLKLTEELNQSLASERGLRDHINRLAITDELTGVLNRRGILDNLKTEMARSVRHRSSLSVFMIDIDHFKAINDNYGHAGGDKALRTVVQSLQEGLRETDVLGRYGGEEFLAILPALEVDGAIIAAERLREKVQATTVSLDDRSVEITISIGIALHRESDTSEQLLASADKALYAAKNNGRNRVEAERPEQRCSSN